MIVAGKAVSLISTRLVELVRVICSYKQRLASLLSKFGNHNCKTALGKPTLFFSIQFLLPS